MFEKGEENKSIEMKQKFCNDIQYGDIVGIDGVEDIWNV